MTQFEKLDLLLRECGGTIQTFQVLNNGISKSVFYAYVKERGLEQAAHGVYVSPDTWTDAMYLFSCWGKSVCSLQGFPHISDLGSYHLLRRKSDFAKLTQKKNAATSKKITTLSKSCSVLSRTFLFALFFDFGNLLCRCGYNPYACIAHTVKKRVELPPLRVLLRRRFQKELVYGYIVAEHKLKENL